MKKVPRLLLPIGIGLLIGLQQVQAGSELDVKSGVADLTGTSAYVQGTAPTSSSDVTFLSGTTYSLTTFTTGSNGSLGLGTLNHLGNQSLIIQNGITGTVNTVTLNGGTNSVSPVGSDLFYVASGTLTIQNGAAGTLNLAAASSGNLNIGGAAIISSAFNTGTNAITKTGTGTLTLGGSNSGTGGFTIASGQVNVGNSAAFGSAANAVTLGSGTATTTINYTLGIAAGVAPTQSLTIASGGVRNITSSTVSDVYLSHAIALNGDLNLASTAGASRFVLSGSITGSKTITITGSNTAAGGVRLAGNNINYSGTTRVLNGVLQLAGTSALGSGQLVLGDTSGTNSTTVSGFNATATNAGGILVQAGNTGVTTLQNLSGQAVTYASNISLQKDLTIKLEGANLNRITGTISTASGYSNTNLNIIVTGSSGSVNGVQFGDGTSALGLVNNAGSITLSGSSSGNQPLVWLANAASIGANVTSLIQNSSAITWSLNNNNSNFGGTVVVNTGTMRLATTDSALNSKAAVSIASGGTLFLDNVSATIAGLNDISGAGGIVTSSTTTSAGKTLTLGGTGSYAFSGSILDGGTNARGLTKAGTGTQALTGTNSYTGITTVNGGVLSVSNLANGGSSSSIGASSAAAGNLVLNSGTLSYTGANVATNRAFTTGTSGGTIEVVSQSANLDFSGAAVGTGGSGLTKTGSGTLALSGTSDNTNLGLTVNAGQVELNKGGSARAVSGGLAINAGVVKLTGASSDQILNTSTVTINGGTLDLNGKSETVGNLAGAGGAIKNDLNATTSTVTFGVSGTSVASSSYAGTLGGGSGALALVKAGNSTQTLTDKIQGNTSVTVASGGGTLSLAGINTYSGDTTINSSGTFSLASTAAMTFYIGANGVSNKIAGAGTVSLDGTFAFDLTGAVAADGNLWNVVNTGSIGTSTVFGANFSVSGFSTTDSTLWTYNADPAYRYQFDETTGSLSVVAVPEPTACAMLVGGLGMLLVLRRRSRF